MAFKGGAVPFSDGLSSRQAGNSDEVQVRIVDDSMHDDVDDEIIRLRSQVRKLGNVAQDIHSETKFQNDFVDQLQMTLIQAQVSLKNNMRKLNSNIVRSGSNYVLHVVLFALGCLFVVYLWSKFSRH